MTVRFDTDHRSGGAADPLSVSAAVCRHEDKAEGDSHSHPQRHCPALSRMLHGAGGLRREASWVYHQPHCHSISTSCIRQAAWIPSIRPNRISHGQSTTTHATSTTTTRATATATTATYIRSQGKSRATHSQRSRLFNINFNIYSCDPKYCQPWCTFVNKQRKSFSSPR